MHGPRSKVASVSIPNIQFETLTSKWETNQLVHKAHQPNLQTLGVIISSIQLLTAAEQMRKYL